MSLNFDFAFPFSSIVVCATMPSGATSQPLIISAALMGRGSCQPRSTSSFNISISFASWPCADLWLPRARLAVTSAMRSASAMSRSGNSAPLEMRSWNFGQSGCNESKGASSSAGRNSDPGVMELNGCAARAASRSSACFRSTARL